MIYSYRLHPLADKDLAQAYAWYEEEQPGLGDRFLELVTEKVYQIVAQPLLFGYKRKGYRETLVNKKFPHAIVYRIDHGKDEIVIAPIFHVKRNPRNKYRK